LVAYADGYAVQVGGSDKARVIVVLSGEGNVIPGSDTQHLLLLDGAGRILDRLSCDINNRLTGDITNPAIFRTEVPNNQEIDGTRLVIRFIPAKGDSISGNWSHEITHRGKTSTFSWEQSERNTIPSAEWERKGLCRVAVRADRFAVLFRRLNPPSSR
jgi:hypothetical protein